MLTLTLINYLFKYICTCDIIYEYIYYKGINNIVYL